MQGASRNFGAVNGALNPRGDDCGRRPSQKNRRARGKALRRLKGWPQIRELGALADRGARKSQAVISAPARYRKVARTFAHMKLRRNQIESSRRCSVSSLLRWFGSARDLHKRPQWRILWASLRRRRISSGIFFVLGQRGDLRQRHARPARLGKTGQRHGVGETVGHRAGSRWYGLPA